MISIAIDGPAGSGKSTIAKLIAEKLDIEYIDTGAMYRAVALYKKENNLSLDQLIKNLNNINIDYKKGKIFLNEKDISNFIRTEEISKLASEISKNNSVREKLVDIQRNLSKSKSVVMEGRDIGSVVLPNANNKFYVDASPEIRAKRRYEQLKEKGISADLKNIEEDIIKRDKNDKTRKNSPLTLVKDAKYIDTSYMSIENVIDKIIKIVRSNNAL
ncbi:cytidylate kinase [Peptoniphilus koenoeneniae]|uniref:Cytidylate kinase n=1 Tax=Peptoniphilus koenoeneniae TaxID=507751 RepID=A0ABU0ASB9_9FIRM|nr:MULTISPECIES: (d)CMP kinase [Peptoniphilus]ERT56732.1 cytidylate kinase [Peptoniphilus sp. BV3C26]MDQ0274166.1 cytidylate kinase [Peptoniphilus koenoeneniae]